MCVVPHAIRLKPHHTFRPDRTPCQCCARWPPSRAISIEHETELSSPASRAARTPGRRGRRRLPLGSVPLGGAAVLPNKLGLGVETAVGVVPPLRGRGGRRGERHWRPRRRLGRWRGLRTRRRRAHGPPRWHDRRGRPPPLLRLGLRRRLYLRLRRRPRRRLPLSR
eukprot:scaffold118100_cov33-Phaeocystis_antarctica.AAC.2